MPFLPKSAELTTQHNTTELVLGASLSPPRSQCSDALISGPRRSSAPTREILFYARFFFQNRNPEHVEYEGAIDLGEELWQRVGRPLGMPHLEDTDVKLLDEAISILNPPEAHVRVVEVDTFMVGGGDGLDAGGDWARPGWRLTRRRMVYHPRAINYGEENLKPFKLTKQDMVRLFRLGAEGFAKPSRRFSSCLAPLVGQRP